MKKSTARGKKNSKPKTAPTAKKSKKVQQLDEELDRLLADASAPAEEEGELPGLIGKEQPLFFFGPPPAIKAIYGKCEFDKDFHPQDMLEHMRNGKTRSEIVAAWGITYTKFNDWITAHPELAEAYSIGIPAFEAYYKSTLRYVSFGMMPKANSFSLHFMLKNLAGFDENGGAHEFAEAQNAELEFVDDE